jgi:hypothetical protein
MASASTCLTERPVDICTKIVLFTLLVGAICPHPVPAASNWGLEPAENEKIVGFYGRSDYAGCFCGIEEFGIITTPKDVELPESVYDLPELQNTDGGTGPVSFLHNHCVLC